MANTLLLNPTTWDLMADATGNIAMATEPYALAQDAASAIKLFIAELWYDTTQGVPYWQQILGKNPPVELIRAQLVAAAMTVPGVVSAQCFIASLAGRAPTGQVQVTDANGVTTTASF